MTKTGAIIVMKKFVLVAPRKFFLAVDVQLQSSKTRFHLLATAIVYELHLI